MIWTVHERSRGAKGGGRHMEPPTSNTCSKNMMSSAVHPTWQQVRWLAGEGGAHPANLLPTAQHLPAEGVKSRALVATVHMYVQGNAMQAPLTGMRTRLGEAMELKKLIHTDSHVACGPSNLSTSACEFLRLCFSATLAAVFPAEFFCAGSAPSCSSMPTIFVSPSLAARCSG